MELKFEHGLKEFAEVDIMNAISWPGGVVIVHNLVGALY